ITVGTGPDKRHTPPRIGTTHHRGGTGRKTTTRHRRAVLRPYTADPSAEAHQRVQHYHQRHHQGTRPGSCFERQLVATGPTVPRSVTVPGSVTVRDARPARISLSISTEARPSSVKG